MAVDLIRRNNQPSVTAYHDAAMIYLAKGANGVVQGIGSGFALSYNGSTKTMTVGSGAGVLYGRQFEIRQGEEVSWDWSALSGTRYISVYVEVDLRNPTEEAAAFKSTYASGAYPTVAPGDNLLSIPAGVARLLMYHVLRTDAGVTVTTQYKLLRGDWIAYAEYAPEAGHAATADDSTKAGGVTVTAVSGQLKAKLPSAATTETIERRRLIYNNAGGIWLTTDGTKTFNASEDIASGDVIEVECAFAGSSYRVRVRTQAGIGFAGVSGTVGFCLYYSHSAAYDSSAMRTIKALFTVSGITLTFRGAWDTYGAGGLTVYNVYKIVGGNA